MSQPTLYYGIVTRTDTAKGYIWATIPELGGEDAEFGPMPMMGSAFDFTHAQMFGGALPTDLAYAFTPRSHYHMADYGSVIDLDIPKGRLVLIGQVGMVPENLIVLGEALIWGGTSG